MGGNKNHAIQTEFLPRRAGQDEVTMVNRVETSAEDSGAHGRGLTQAGQG